ncbi:MAG: hypothetical protein NTY81_01060 [Candidatus Staskawiczbacteria bacterium]|nr:hypothetical protein [Candidatus Staskawiczbacteria bacterium]
MSDNTKEKIENKIIDLIALNAKGRLVVFKPENLDNDLVVEKKGDYKKKVIALDIFGKDEINQLVEKADLKPVENFYLLVVSFDIVKQDIEDNFLVVPSLKFKELAGKNDFFKFSMSKKEFVSFLIKELEKK